MALRIALDYTALGWVKPDLDLLLQQAQRLVESCEDADAQGDAHAMGDVARELHQVRGTLRMLDLTAPALVAEEMERVALALGDGRLDRREPPLRALHMGTLQLPDYLDRLLGGHREIPIVLLPLLNELRAARGADALAETALFEAGLAETFDVDAPAPSEAELAHAQGALSGRNRTLLGSVSGMLKEDMNRIQDALDLYLRGERGDVAELAPQVEALDRVAVTVGMLGMGGPREALLEKRDSLRALVEAGGGAGEIELLEIASVLLQAQAALDQGVDDLGEGSAPAGQSGVELRELVAALAAEAVANFAEVRQAMVAFVETRWDHTQLQDVPRLLQEVTGAVHMLELPEAVDTLRSMAAYIGRELLEGRRIPDAKQLDTLADAVSSQEYYLEALADQRAGRDEILEITRSSLEALGYWPLPAAPALQPVAQPTDVDDVDDSGQIERNDADQPAQPGHDEIPAAPEQGTQAGSVPAAAAAPAVPVAPAQAAAASFGQPRVGGFEAASDDIDDEIREIFLEEFEEEMGNLEGMLGHWHAMPGDVERLRPVRRVFHTLKGSGRLVGARALGEFSWKIENMLNRVLDGSRPASPAVIAMVGHAQSVLPQLHAALKGEADLAADLDGMALVADRLAAGEDAQYVPPVQLPEADDGAADNVAEAALGDGVEDDDSQPLQADEAAGPAAGADDLPASIDAVLLEILDTEVGGHLQTVDDWIARAPFDASVDEGLMRAVHTMSGAFAMAEVPAIGDALSPAEGLIKRLLSAERAADAEAIEAITDLAAAVRGTLVRLQTQAPRVRPQPELAARLRQLRDALPEPQMMLHDPHAVDADAAGDDDRADHDARATALAEEASRLQAEQAAQADRDRLESERVEAIRLEAERIEAERIEAERIEAERIEAERIEAERIEAERIEAERVESERIEGERIEAERIEAERIEAERIEAERIEAERIEAERIEAERIEAERIEAERIEAERIEAERIEAERIEAKRIESERIEAERAEADRAEAERIEAEGVEAERTEAERVEAERIEAERLSVEQAAGEAALQATASDDAEAPSDAGAEADALADTGLDDAQFALESLLLDEERQLAEQAAFEQAENERLEEESSAAESRAAARISEALRRAQAQAGDSAQAVNLAAEALREEAQRAALRAREMADFIQIEEQRLEQRRSAHEHARAVRRASRQIEAAQIEAQRLQREAEVATLRAKEFMDFVRMEEMRLSQAGDSGRSEVDAGGSSVMALPAPAADADQPLVPVDALDDADPSAAGAVDAPVAATAGSDGDAEFEPAADVDTEADVEVEAEDQRDPEIQTDADDQAQDEAEPEQQATLAETAPASESTFDEDRDWAWLEPRSPAADATAPTPSDVSSLEDDLDFELVDLFLEEAGDLLDHSDSLLAGLQGHEDDRKALVGLQRDLHTLKGGARMAGLMPVGELGHAMETLLEAVVEQRTTLGGDGVALLQQGLDTLHGMVGAIGRREAVAQPQALVDAFDARARAAIPADAPALDDASLEAGEATETGALQAADQPTVADAPLPVTAEDVADSAHLDHAHTTGEADAAGEASAREPAREAIELPPLSPPITLQADDEVVARAPQEQVRIRADLLDRLVNYAGEVAIYRARLEQQLGAFRGAMREMAQTNTRLHDQLRRLDIETEAQIIARYQREQDAADASFDPLELDRFSTLQQLSRALGESAADMDSLQGTLGDLTRQYESLLLQQSRVSSDLQEGLMRTHMVPFDGLLPRLRRVVRQAASDSGKLVQLQAEGTHGEIDRSVLERMTSPLEHMLRNAVAHGLEDAPQRAAAGKPAEGRVSVAVRSEGSEVVLVVADDGAGIDREAVRRRGEQRGLVREGSDVPDAVLDSLIFQPGFTTSEEVTRLAGRGVGMDVVASEVRQLGGSIDISSERGRGTRFTLRLPQMLAVTQAVFVRIGETTFAVPIASVRGVGRIDRKAMVQDDASYRYGNEDFAVHDLGTLLGQAPAQAEGQLQMPLLLVGSGDLRAAVAVDEVLGNREIVVKPVGPQIASIPGIFGATIMGDGGVVVILDIAPLVRRRALDPDLPVAAPEPVQRHDVPLVMVVDDSVTMRKVTGRVLERQGFEVVAARDGVDALERMDENVPDLMLLDIEMPRMDGYELATHMRADPRMREVPIIMITSRSGEKHRQRAFEIGVQRYLGKPYQEVELLRNVHELLREQGFELEEGDDA